VICDGKKGVVSFGRATLTTWEKKNGRKEI
jgi:hypothetical protein